MRQTADMFIHEVVYSCKCTTFIPELTKTKRVCRDLKQSRFFIGEYGEYEIIMTCGFV